MENKWCFAFVPTLALSLLCRISGLVLGAHFRRIFCVRAAQAPSQKCHCTSGTERSWCLSSGSQAAALFSSRQTQGVVGDSAALQSGICFQNRKQTPWTALNVFGKSFLSKSFLPCAINHVYTNKIGVTMLQMVLQAAFCAFPPQY